MRSVIFSSFIISAAANLDFVVALLSALVGVFAVIVATLSIVLAKRVQGDKKKLERYVYQRKKPDKPAICANTAENEHVDTPLEKKARHGKKNKQARKEGSEIE